MENIKFYITNTLLLIIAIGVITYVATSVVKHFEKEKIVYFCEYYDFFGQFDFANVVTIKPLDSFNVSKTNPKDGNIYEVNYSSKKMGHFIKDGIKIESYVIREKHLLFEGGETLPLIDSVKFKTAKEGWLKYKDEQFNDTSINIGKFLPAYTIDINGEWKSYPSANPQNIIGNVTPAEPPKND